MSQAIAAEADRQISDSFDYKPVPVMAPIALVLGLASAFALLAEIGLAVCLAGIIVSILAIMSVRRGGGAYGGSGIATIGLAASAFFLVAGSATHIYAYATEVPDGYYRVNFSRDISDKQFVFVDGKRQLHKDVAPYDGQKIFIKGYMWNTNKVTGISDFILLKDNGQCCFGGDPKPYDMMHVKLKNGMTVGKIEGLVSVAGVLKCQPNAKEGAVYFLEVDKKAKDRENDHCQPARTSH